MNTYIRLTVVWVSVTSYVVQPDTLTKTVVVTRHQQILCIIIYRVPAIYRHMGHIDSTSGNTRLSIYRVRSFNPFTNIDHYAAVSLVRTSAKHR